MKKEKKQKSKLRKTLEWIGTGIIAALFLFVASCNICKLITKDAHNPGYAYGYNYFTVLTDSMEPKYKTDTAILIKKADAEEIYQAFIADSNYDEYELTDDRKINLTFYDGCNLKLPTDKPGFGSRPTKNTETYMTHQVFDIKKDESAKMGQGRYTFFVHGINAEAKIGASSQYQVFTERELIGVVKSNSKGIGVFTKFITSPWGLLVLILIPALYLVVNSCINFIKAYNEEEENDRPVTASMSNFTPEEIERLKQEMIDEMLSGKDKK